MRRLHALLISAGLAAAPVSAAAGPSQEDSRSSPSTIEKVETFEWSTSKGRLGVMVMSLTPELRKHLGAAGDRGVLVARVEAGTPAAAAGIAVGDVIVEVRGRRIDGAADVLSALAGANKGQRVAVELVRDRKPLSLQATLADDAPPASLDSSLDSTSGIQQRLRDLMEPFFGPWRSERSWDPFEESWFRDLRERVHRARPNTATQPT